MKTNWRMTWTLANAIGLAVAFITIAELVMLIEHGLDFQKQWQFVPPGQTIRAYVGRLVASLAGGTILGVTQALVLRSRLRRVIPWVLSATVGFGLVAIFMWALMLVNVWGRIPGPVEPIVGTVGSCSLAGLFQYMVLRNRGIGASKWLVLWIVGLIASIVPTALIFMSIEAIDLTLSWPLEILLNGFVCGSVAALLSGGALLASISAKDPRGR